MTTSLFTRRVATLALLFLAIVGFAFPRTSHATSGSVCFYDGCIYFAEDNRERDGYGWIAYSYAAFSSSVAVMNALYGSILGNYGWGGFTGFGQTWYNGSLVYSMLGCTNGVVAYYSPPYVPPPPPSCSPQYYCSGSNVYYQDSSCGTYYIQGCGYGCSGGACSAPPPPACTPQYYCSGYNQYYQDSSCNSSYIQYCSYGCSGGGCTAPPAPSCTLSLNASSVNYGSGTYLNYSSSNSNSYYISNVGYVSPNTSASTFVAPGATTAYTATCSGTGGSAYASSGTQTLTVIPPPTPASHTTITASSTSIQVGQSTTIRATFAAGTGDYLAADNIDFPFGTGVGASTNPDAVKTYTFTPSAAGTYTFYARATTSYYPAWTTYATVTVTVTAAAPTCSISVSPTSILQNQYATLTWTSTNATSGVITGVGAVAASGSTSVSPLTTTTFSGTFVGAGGSANCSASGGGNRLTVTCAPLYSCSGQNVTYTDAACAVSTVASCSAPLSCVAGQSACQGPPPSFNPLTTTDNVDLDGHLTAHPSIISTGHTSRLYWDVSNVVSCAVAGDGQNWTGLTSGTGGVLTNVLTQRTTYTLTCVALAGNANVNESFDVLVTPSFGEH